MMYKRQHTAQPPSLGRLGRGKFLVTERVETLNWQAHCSQHNRKQLRRNMLY